MRYATFSTSSNSTPPLGIVTGEQIAEAAEFKTLLELIQAGPAAWKRAAPTSQAYALRDVRLHAPIPRPLKNVFCLGRNYAEHVREGAKARGQEFKLPTHPVFFTKAPTIVIGPTDISEWEESV